MEYTLLLAKLFGLYFIVMGLAMIYRKKDFQEAIHEITKSSLITWITGIMLFVLGGLIVFTHNIWEGTLATLVSLFGWIIFIKGLVYLLLPHKSLKALIGSINTSKWFLAGGLISLVVGVYMTGISFGWF